MQLEQFLSKLDCVQLGLCIFGHRHNFYYFSCWTKHSSYCYIMNVGLKCTIWALRPCPHKRGYFKKRSFFFAVWPFFHTQTLHRVTETEHFWKLLKTLLQCYHVDSETGDFGLWRQSMHCYLCLLETFSGFWFANMALRLRLYRHLLVWHALDSAS